MAPPLAGQADRLQLQDAAQLDDLGDLGLGQRDAEFGLQDQRVQAALPPDLAQVDGRP